MIEGLAAEESYDKLQRVLEAMDQAKARLTANVNFETTMELVMLQMKGL